MFGKFFLGGVRYFSLFFGFIVVVLCFLLCIKYFNFVNDGILDIFMVS